MADDTDSMEADKSLHIPRPKRNLIKKSIKVSRSYRTLNPNMESSNEPDPLDRIAKLESKFHLHFHTPNDIKKPSDIIQSLDSTPLPKIRVKLPAISSSKQVTRNDTCVKVYRDISYRLESLDTVEKVTEEKLQSELFGAIYSPSPSSPPYPITIEELRRVNESISVTPGTFIKHDVFKSIPPEFYLKQNEDTLFASLLKNPKENKRMGARSLGPPSGRNDAIALLSWLNTIFDKLNKEPLKELERYELAQTVYYIAFAEVIRQVSVHCLERGLLMRKLWQSYVSLIEHLSGEYNEKRKKQKRKHEKRIEQIHTFYEKDIEDTRKDALKAKSEMEEKVQENAELKEVIEKQLEQLTEYGEKLEEERYKGLAVLQQYEAIKEKYEDVIEENRKLNVELKEMKESEDFYRVRSIEMIKENKAKEELRKAKVYKESEAQTEQTLIIEENVQAENINAKAKCVLSANNKVGVISIEKKTKKGKKKKGLRKKPAIISDATQTKQANYWGIVYEAAELDLAWEKDIKEEKVEVMEDTVPKDITRKNIVRSFSIQPSKGVRKMVVRENPLVKQKTMEEAPIKPSALREVQRVIHEEVHENLKDKAELVHNPQRELFAEYKKEPDLATEKVDDSSHYTRDNLVQEPDRTLEVGTITENDEVINAEILEMPAKENNDEPSIKENDNSQSEVQIEYKSEIKAEKEQSPLKVQNNGEMEKIEVDSGKKFNTKSDSPKSKPIAVQPKYTLKDHSQAQAPLEKQKKTQSKDTKKKIKISPTKPTHILETNEKDNVKLDKSNLPGEILKRVKPANANTSNNKKSQRVDYPQRLPTQQIMRESSEKKINKLTKPPANPPILNQPPPQTTVPVKPYAEKAFTVETELQKPVECKQKHQVPIEIQPSVATHSFNTSGVDKTQPINISKPTLQAPESVVNENRTASSPPPFQSDTLIEKNKALEQENSELRDKLVNLLTKFQQVQDDSASLGRIMHKLGDTHEKGEFQKLVENAKQLAQKNSESLRFEHRERRHRVKEDNSSKTAEKLRIMAQTENCKVEPLPKKMLLKTITTYYNECISGKTIQSLSGYVYSDLQNRFGLKTVADRKFLQIVNGCLRYNGSLRIKLFGRFLGLFNHISTEDFKNILKALEYMNSLYILRELKNRNVGIILNNSEYEEKPLTAYEKVVECIKHFFESKLPKAEYELLLSEVQKLQYTDPRCRDYSFVEIDKFMELFLHYNYKLSKHCESNLSELFTAADIEEKGYLTFEEFDMLLMMMDSENYTETHSKDMFEKFAELDEGKGLTLQNLAALSTKHEKFNEKSKERLMKGKIVSKKLIIERLRKAGTYNKKWGERIDKIKAGELSHKLVTQYSAEVLKKAEFNRLFPFQGICNLNVKLSVYGNTRVGYKMLKPEFETLRIDCRSLIHNSCNKQ